MVKRASYREGIEWIGINDEPLETDPEVIAEQISVMLLADLFGKPYATVAKDVLKWRARRVRADRPGHQHQATP